MRKPSMYRMAVRMLPGGARIFMLIERTVPDFVRIAYFKALRRHKAKGGALVLFDMNGITDHYVYGKARKGIRVDGQTAFRLASVSKMVSAAGMLAMRQQGLLDLERDAGLGLPYSLRHPAAPETPVSLRMLLSHTAGIRDGKAYTDSLTMGGTAGELLKQDSHTAHLPGEGCEYSNFGFGLAACALEAQTGLPFQTAMRRYLFEPLQMNAAFHPALLDSVVADARRVLPPARRPNYDGAARQAQQPEGLDRVDLERHHLMAHGGCVTDVAGLVKLGQALMRPGFLTQESLDLMRAPLGSLAARDPHLAQGLGLFILNDPTLYPRPLYGHQGMAYGAVHMVFLDAARGRGLISLTVGASEARTHILADINRALLAIWGQDA